MQMLLRSLIFLLTLLLFNGVQAANQLSITLEQSVAVSRLKLLSYDDHDIIWQDEQGNPTQLPEEISATASISFYGRDNTGLFDLGVIYNIEESGHVINNSIAIDMDEQSCYVNGSKEDSFTSNKYTYYVKAEISPFSPDNVFCNVLIRTEQHAGQTPFIQHKIDNQSQTSPIPSEPPRHTGILTQGKVTLGRSENNSTTCAAVSFSDCATAAAQSVSAGIASPTFVFTADTLNWIMEGELHYVIQDPELNTAVNLIVTLQDGSTLLDQCVAQISPATTDQVQYQVQTKALENNLCHVTLIRSLSALPNSPTMQLVINNQSTRIVGAGSYSYALKQTEVEVMEGIFNATPVDIPVNQTQTLVLSALNGTGSHYQANLYYAFDDYLMNTVPTGLQITIDKTESEEVSAWCKAAITGWNESYRFYQVNAEVTGDAENAICTINITSEDNPNQPISYKFSQIDALPTEGIRQWEHFIIDGQHYLAAANGAVNNSDYINQNIFRFDRNNNKFVGLNNLVVGYRCLDSSYNEVFKDHVYGWQYFEVDDRKRLIMANYYTYPWKQGSPGICDTSQTDNWAASYIYDFRNGEFDMGDNNIEFLMTDSAIMWEFYTNAGQTYLAAAELGHANQSRASIYHWSNGKLNKMNQPNLNVPDTQFIEAFSIDGQTYLLFSFGVENQEAQIYRVDSDGQLILHQGRLTTPNHVLAPEGLTTNSKVFNVGNEYFLIFGFLDKHTAKSWVYHFEYVPELQRSLFVPYQTLHEEAKTAKTWATFSINNKLLLIAILSNHNVVAYQWNTILQQIETHFSYPIWSTGDYLAGVNNFNVDQTPYIALAIQQDKNNNTRTYSPILRWQQVNQ